MTPRARRRDPLTSSSSWGACYDVPMRVTVLEDEPDRLVVRIGPWFGWWTWVTRLAGGAMALCVVIPILGLFDRVSLTCDRAHGRCTAVEASIFGSERREFAPAALLSATLNPAGVREGGIITLQIEDEAIRLASYTDAQESDAREAVDEINRFVNSPAAPRLDAGFDSLIISLMMAMVFVAAVPYFGWWGRVTTCTFDRMTNTYTARRSMIIPLTRTGPLDAITDVDVRTKKGKKSDDIRYVVELLLTGDRRYHIDGDNGLGAAQGLQSLIRRFLKGSAPTTAATR